MELSRIFLLVAFFALFSACELWEKDILSFKGRKNSYIVHSIDGLYNETLQLKSLLKFLQFKDLSRKPPFILYPFMFEDLTFLYFGVETDVCGSSDLRKYTIIMLKHKIMTGIAYGCHSQFKNLFKIVIATTEEWENIEDYSKYKSGAINPDFASQVCNCEKIVDDFTQNCLHSHNGDSEINIRVVGLIFILLLFLIFGFLKCFLKSEKVGDQTN